MTPAKWLVTIKVKNALAEARRKGIQNVIDHKQTGGSNRYCAWVSSSRRYTEQALFRMFSSVECASGGRTKFNREQLGLPKDLHYDALCVGSIPTDGYKDLTNGRYFVAKAIDRGSRLRGSINKCGIITVKYKQRAKRRFGVQNGDIVRAIVPKGKYAGHHVGRVMSRTSGFFDIRKADNSLVTVNQRYCTLLQHDNGYLCLYK